MNISYPALLLSSALLFVQFGVNGAKAQVNEPFCYMRTPNGRTVDLTKLCDLPKHKPATDKISTAPKLCVSPERGRYVEDETCESGTQIPILENGYPDFGSSPVSSNLVDGSQ